MPGGGEVQLTSLKRRDSFDNIVNVDDGKPNGFHKNMGDNDNNNVMKKRHPSVENEKSMKSKDSRDDVEKVEDLNYFQLFRYATGSDFVMVLIGTIAALGVGCGVPINFLIFGNVINEFVGIGSMDYANRLNVTMPPAGGLSSFMGSNVTKKISETIFNETKWFLILSGVFFVAGFLQMVFWQYSALRQVARIRFKLFRSIMHQEVTWQDRNKTGDLVTRLSDQVNTIQHGLGDKMAVFLQYFATFVFGLLIGFIKNWKLALITFGGTPLIALSLLSAGLVVKRMTAREIRAYGQAGSIAEEVLYAIRTVIAFGGEKKEAQRYHEKLRHAERAGICKSLLLGASLGSVSALIFSVAGLSFWYGTETIINDKTEPGTVIQVFFCTFIAGISLGNAFQSLEEFWNAIGSAKNTFSIIERQSQIDIDKEGLKPQQMQGRIEFKDVTFQYPSRPGVQILNGLSFTVEPGETVALVGESGSGKSTVMHLLQRFYDNAGGKITVDNNAVDQLDLSWFRQHVGVVQQEPSLFAGSVGDNIRLGRIDATDEEIEQAARMANAHDFIMKIPGDYKGIIGEGGGQLSGGQKQRVAIARALIRRPKILLLDEATSALDNRSEALVQEALDAASASRDCTVIMIAHRLTTVRNADRIIVIRSGMKVEEGSHDELMDKQGEYYRLVMKQNSNKKSRSNLPSVSVTEETEKQRFKRGLDGIEEGEILLSKDDDTDDETDLPDVEFVIKSLTERDEEEDVEENGKKKKKKPKPKTFKVMRRAMGLNSPETCYIILGVVSSLLAGAMMPCFSILYSEILRVYAMFATPDEMRRQTALFSGLLGAAAGCTFCLNILKNWAFGVSGERLTRRLRSNAFEAILRQEVGWYDQNENQPGILATRLASDASFVKGVTGVRLGVTSEAIVTLGTSIIIAFVFGWKLTLVVLAFVPILVGVGMIQGRAFSSGLGVKSSAKDGNESHRLAQESIGNIRTVISLNREEYFYQKYVESYVSETKSHLRHSMLFGLFAGLSQGVLFCSYAAIFTFGAYLVDQKEMQFYNVFRVFSAITFGSTAMGRASALVPDLSKAVRSTVNIFRLIDRKPLISATQDSGEIPTMPCSGIVDFKDVQFSYPTRENVTVLQGLSVDAQPGETVALVGESGCGKSTLMQILLRFYDIQEGSVSLDSKDIKSLSVPWLRSQIGLVSQEPVLFSFSIRDNIAYGDNTRDISMSEIIDAAREANIHGFISSLPEGYDTLVGSRGSQLSGGQKQRIAIARALVRKPKVLLLDEATSALDSDSERVVQEALDRARKGRTCLVIAHRLSTIENADKIAVIANGGIVEFGTHGDLMTKRGAYFQIHSGST